MFDLAISGAAILLISLLGAAVLSLTSLGRNLEGLALLTFSAAFGTLSFAAMGLIVVSMPTPYGTNAWVCIFAAAFLACLRCWRHRVWARLVAGQSAWLLAGLGSWALAAWIALAATFVPVEMPNPLPDGAYVIKNDRLHVKIQRMLGDFPADNYLPFVAAQFLLKDIQFAVERPLMPGQEVSNRPILLSLAVIPILAILSPPQRQVGPLPKFRYVGTRWPDVSILGEDGFYRDFLRVAVVFNATLALAAVLLLQTANVSILLSAMASAVYLTSPYFLGQTLFVWPKSLAAFLLITSAIFILKHRHTYVAGVLAAAAYWAHPYAIVFIASFSLYLAWRERNDVDLSRGVLPFVSASMIGIAAWYAWTSLYLGIPSNLVQQNVYQTSISDAVIARIINFRNAVFPPPDNWLQIDNYSRMAIVSLFGAVGPFLFVPAILGSIRIVRINRAEITLLLIVPSIVIVAAFSNLVLPAVHGLQPMAALLLVGSFWQIKRSGWETILIILAILQILFNLALLVGRVNFLSLTH